MPTSALRQTIDYQYGCGCLLLSLWVVFPQSNEHANAMDSIKLLRARRKRPSSCRTTNQ
jgi:hypothetical protein